jgi:hypothetical protein
MTESRFLGPLRPIDRVVSEVPRAVPVLDPDLMSFALANRKTTLCTYASSDLDNRDRVRNGRAGR